jgi:cyclopropane fatty-acyl-phospholipid synthase-like methyltransferase
MSETDDLEPLQNQVDIEKRAAEALRAHYIKTLQQLRAILQRQAELQSLWTELDGDAHHFE